MVLFYSMFRIITFFVPLMLTASLTMAQDESPEEITPEQLQKMQAAIEARVLPLQQQLKDSGFSVDEIAFITDTFRIQQLATRSMEVDYSTYGMNEAIARTAAAYDKLLNKYYTRLQQALAPADRKTLIRAQKAWLAYRDAEKALIALLSKPDYSGGGTIQSTLAASAYAAIVEKRTVELFNYYNSIVREE